MGKNAKVQTAGASLLPQVGSDTDLMVDTLVLPLEPRVLLDANLEWELSPATAATSVLSSIAQVFETSFGDVTDFLDDFSENAAEAFSVVSAIVGTAEDVTSQDLGAVVEAVERIQSAIDLVKDGSISHLMDLLDTDFRTALVGGLELYLAAENSGDANYSVPSNLSTELDNLFTLTNLASGNFSAQIDTFIGNINLGAADSTATLEKFHELVGSATGLSTQNFGVELVDISVNGSKIVSFETDLDGNVDVSVSIPQSVVDFSQSLLNALPGGAMPFELEFLGSSTDVLSFELETEANFTGDILDDLSLHIHEFDFAPLLEVGGLIALPADADLSIGFLEIGLTGAETAQLKVIAQASTGLDLGFSVLTSGAGGVDFLGSSASITLETQIQEIGASSFVEIAEDQSYDLLDVDFAGALEFGGINQAFEGGIVLSSVLDSSGPSGRIQGFFEALNYDFEFDMTNGTLDPAQAEVLEQALHSLVTIGTEEITGFLEDVGDSISGMLLDSVLDVDIPLTDLGLGDLLTQISTVFTDLVDTFSISPVSLGFYDTSTISAVSTDADVYVDTNLTHEISEQTGAILSDAQLDNLLDYDQLQLSVLVEDATLENVEIDLVGTDVLDTSKSKSERLAALVDLFNTALSTYNIVASLAANFGLRFASSQIPSSSGGQASYNTFAITGARKLDATVDDAFSLASLGFGASNTTEPANVFAEGVTETVLNYALANTSFELFSLDLTDLAGVKDMRFSISVDGIEQFVDVVSDTGWSTISDLIGDFNTALASNGFGIVVSENSGTDGLQFDLNSDELRRFTVNQDGTALLRALNVEGLISWVNSELGDVFPGSELSLSSDGELIFTFPELTQTLSITTDDEAYLSAEDLNLGVLSNAEISGALTASIEATLSAGIGIDLVGFGSDLVGTSGASNASEAAQSSSGRLGDAVFNNVFFNDLGLSAQIDATASDISGSADLGILAITIGGADPALNFATINAQFDANVLGTDDEGNFNEKLSLANLKDAVLDEVVSDGSGGTTLIESSGLSSLLGRFEMLGGVVVNGAGRGLDSNGDIATTAADVETVDDAFSYSGQDELVQLLVNMGDVSVDVAGIPGINENLVDGVSFSVGDLTDIGGTFDISLLSNDPAVEEAIASLTNLEDGDILDTMVSIANMLVLVSDTLSDKLPFLATDIPLINLSVLDQLSFAAEFLESLQDLRNDPQSGLDTLKDKLEDVFGTDTVTLEWDADKKTVLFELSFTFLEEYSTNLPFQIDLAQILGDQLEALVGSGLASVVTNLVDASGDGELIFDPLLSLNFAFGIDLSPTLVAPEDIVAADVALDSIATTSTINMNPNGGEDVKITWRDMDAGTIKSISIDLDGLETLDAVVAAINTQAQAEFGSTVSFSFSETTGQLTLADTDSEIIVDTSAVALFGAATVDAAEDDGIYSIAFDIAFSDWAAAQNFTVNIGEEAIALGIAEEAGRDQAGFIAAMNAALDDASVTRRAISDSAAPFVTIGLSQLMSVELNGSGELLLKGTNFAQEADFDAIEFSISGEDQSKDIMFSIDDLGGANISKLLGFDDVEDGISGDLVSEVLYDSVSVGMPRIYLDTESTAIRAEFIMGVNDGLNVELGLGPLTVQIVDGKALVNAGDGSGDAAYIELGINDIDGDDNENEYDLSHLFEISSDDGLSFANLFTFDAAIGIDIDLPLTDSLGIFDADEHGLSWTASLLDLAAPIDIGSVDLNDLAATFSGELINLYSGLDIDFDNLDFELPLDEIATYLADFNVLGLLNDPATLLGGIDTILAQMQGLFDDYLSDINLPIVGDAIGAGVTFFDDFRYNIIQPALEYASTPLEDGSLPTTVDLLTGFLNDEINNLFGTTGVEYIQAFLDTSGSTDESYVYGTLNFGAVIFDEMMDIDFDFGIPGFNMEVEQGSQIQMQLLYGVNIGFGVDKNGFFLLNDTDDEEITIDFTVDAGTFEGTMSVFDVLGLNARAVTLGADGFIDESETTNNGGTAKLTASLTADLYGDTGLEIVDPSTQGTSDAVTTTQAYRDFSGVTPQLADQTALGWEKVVYLGQLDTGNLISFGFAAEIDVVIGLEGNILDPITGFPVEVNGAAVIPSVNAELIFNGMFDTIDGLQLNALSFENVRVDASVIYTALIEPILKPIMKFIEPLADFFGFLNSEPLTYIVDILGSVFPILKIADSVITLVADISNFVDTLHATGGMIIFGDFDFSSNIGDLQSGEVSFSDIGQADVMRDTSASNTGGSNFGVFGSDTSGLSIELPLLTDPFSAMSILMGNFEEVDLVRATFTLFNLDYGPINIADEVLSSLGAPGWVRDIISSVFEASIQARLIAKFEAGYDLSGVVNFANTLDPERLLDGVFIDAAPGSLVDVYLGMTASLNAGIAGLSVGGHAAAQLSFNDPNNDGKLRIPELIAIVEAAADAVAAGDVLDSLGYIFKGSASYGFFLSVWAGIDFAFFSLKWSTTVFDFDGELEFGGNPLSPEIGTEIESTGDTAFLNVGARAGGNFSDIEEDGDDIITVSGPNSPVSVSLQSGGQSISGTIGSASTTPGAIVIPAGEGNNVVDLTGVNGLPTITYAGGGNDIIRLPSTGVHVVFAGGGNDEITAPANASGTYIIFGEDGEDTVTISGGNVVYFGDADFEMRDRFLVKFAAGGVTETEILDLIGLNANGTVNTSAAANYTMGDTSVNLAGLIDGYTAGTQLKASNDVETVTVGSGNHVIFTGAADDVVTASLSGTGEVRILAGDGDDIVRAGGSDVFIEGGAGQDLIQVDGANTEVWGWGKAAGESGLTASSANIDALALRDGADVLIGGSGDDALYGQLGGDVIQGGLGDDKLSGGLSDDFITGGEFEIIYQDTSIDIATFDFTSQLASSLLISTQDMADGDDAISGGAGKDILLGGGGSDTLEGDAGNDALLGDFGKISLSANLIAEGAITNFDNSANSGTDMLTGGAGNDLLIAGAALAGESETLSDLYGSNTFLGDFGQIEGARILDAATVVRSIASTSGGADTMESGRGNDIHIGGEGSDVILTGLGGDIVLGDLGTIDITEGTITGLNSSTDGDDTITVGLDTPAIFGAPGTDDLVDFVITSGGDDTINSADGDLHAITGAGVFTINSIGLAALRSYTPLTDGASEDAIATNKTALARIASMFESSQSTAHADDGNDTITSTGGNLSAILGGGDDTAILGDGVNYVLADDGKISVELNDDFTGSLVTLESASSVAASNDDVVVAGNGVNLVTGGLGADQITLGNGDNLILGDHGTLVRDDRTEDLGVDVTSAAESVDGSDQITLGDGVNALVAGGGGDTVIAGDGGNLIIGDSGIIAVDAEVSSLTTLDDLDGGNDMVTTGIGADYAILGTGDDTADLGDGDNLVLGDSGTIFVRETSETTLFAGDQGGDGSDDITTGSGADNIIAGFEADTVMAGAGQNTVIGDRGQIVQDAGRGHNVTVSAETLDAGVGYDDTITTLDGSDIILGGFGSDTIYAGAGHDLVLGDDGSYVSSAATGVGALTSTLLATGGDDHIEAEDGNDVVIASLGDDTVMLGAGEDVALGDDAVVTFVNSNDVETIELTNQELGGNDMLSALDAAGDNIVVGQAGSDTIIGGGTDDAVIGDLALFTLSSFENVYAGQSVVDRLTNITSIRTDISGNDVVNAGDGADIVIGGFGDDEIYGESGQDILVGDTVIYERSFTPTDMGGFTEDFTIETNFAFDVGGTDHLDAGDGADILIGGLGPDLFVGNTADDLIYSDGYAGIFQAIWGNSGFLSETAHRALMTSNFAGPGAIDVISSAQQKSSMGAPLTDQLAMERSNILTQDSELEQSSASGTLDQNVIEDMLAYLERREFLEAIGTLAVSGVDSEVLSDAIIASLMSSLVNAVDGDAAAYEVIVKQLVDYILSRLAVQDGEQENADADVNDLVLNIAAE